MASSSTTDVTIGKAPSAPARPPVRPARAPQAPASVGPEGQKTEYPIYRGRGPYRPWPPPIYPPYLAPPPYPPTIYYPPYNPPPVLYPPPPPLTLSEMVEMMLLGRVIREQQDGDDD